MSDNGSYKFCSRLSEGEVGQSVAMEAQRMVNEAAMPVPAGETIKGQLRSAARALGYRDGDWRIKAAWYGEASTWSATAFEDLKQRFERMMAKRAKANEQQKPDDTIAARIEVIEQWAMATDPDFFRDAVEGLRAAAHQSNDAPPQLDGEDSPMDDRDR